jgi:hypothetical protein
MALNFDIEQVRNKINEVTTGEKMPEQIERDYTLDDLQMIHR